MQKKMRMGICLMAALSCLTLAACGGDTAKYRDVPAQELTQAITEKVEFSMLSPMDAETMAVMYPNLDTSKLADSSVQFTMVNIKANELAVFKVQDAQDTAMVEQACRERAQTIAQNFAMYLEDQKTIAENPLIQTYGNYVLFAIHEDTAQIQNIFEQLIQG